MLQQARYTLGSVDECAPLLNGTGWEVDFRQLDKGVGGVNLDIISGESCDLLRLRLAKGVHQLAVPPPGRVTFGLPTRPQEPGRIGVGVLESESLTCFDQAHALDVVSKPGFEVYTISFPRAQLARLARLWRGGEDCNWDSLSGGQRLPDSGRLIRLRSLLAQVHGANGCAGSESPVGCPGDQQQFSDELALAVLETWFGAQENFDARPGRRSMVIKRAMACIHDSPRSAVSVEALCRESASSISTLERAFREHFGVSPKQYLTALRLSEARRILLAPESSGSIGDIAAQCGFWHASKFSADYRKMFGELPSATRHAARS